MEQFFDIHKVSKPSSVDNTVKFKDEITIISAPPSFKNITPVSNEQISTEPKILSTLNNSEPITSTLPKINVSNVQSIQPTNNKILSTMPTLNEPTVFNNNIIIPQTAFNNKTPYWGTDNINLQANAPIDISNNIISLNNSTVTAGVYTVAEITVDEKGIIQDISSGFIPPNDDWSFFPALGNVDMDNNLIKNLSMPVDNNDATTKNYVDTEIITLSNDISGSYVNLLTAQDISGVKTFLNTPVCANLPLNNNELSNKQYIDTEIITLSNDISGSYVNLLTAQDISGVKTFLNTPVSASLPINNNQIANKQYVDSAVSGAVGAYLPLAGGTMAGNIDMSGNDLNNIGSVTAGGITESITFGQALLPMAGVNVYATNVSMNSYNPISAMNFIGVGGVNINAPDEDINLNAGDINLTQTQATSFMNLTAVGGIVLGAGAGVDITGGGAVIVNAGTYINMTCPGNISIGSGNVLGADTEIEKVGFLDNTIYKAGTLDLEIDNVAKVKNGTSLIEMLDTGIITINTPSTSINLDETSTIITLTAPNIINMNTPSAVIQAPTDASLVINNSSTSQSATYGLGSSGQAHIEGSAGLGSTFLDVGADISLYSPVNGVLVLNNEGYFNLLRPAYGQLFSTSSQSVNTISGVAILFTGIGPSLSITSNSGVPSQIIFQYAGKYRFFYTLQLDKSGVTSAIANVWLKKNGANITGTNKRVTIVGPGTISQISAEYILDIVAGDIIEVWFISSDTGVLTRATTASSAFASGYSIVASINRIAV